MNDSVPQSHDEQLAVPSTVQVSPDLVKPTWSRAWAGAAIVALVGSVATLVVAGLMSIGDLTLPVHDETATATVTRVDQEHYSDPQYDPCGPAYTFRVGDQTYTATSPNVHEKYCQFAVGDDIDITFDPADPANLTAPAARYTSDAEHAPLVAGIAGLLFVVSVVAAVVAVRRRR